MFDCWSHCQCMLTSVLAALWFYVWLLTPCQCMLTSVLVALWFYVWLLIPLSVYVNKCTCSSLILCLTVVPLSVYVNKCACSSLIVCLTADPLSVYVNRCACSSLIVCLTADPLSVYEYSINRKRLTRNHSNITFLLNEEQKCVFYKGKGYLSDFLNSRIHVIILAAFLSDALFSIKIVTNKLLF